MPIVAIPALMRSLTNGEDSVTISGTTIREVIDNLEIRYPGTKEKLCEGDRIRPGIGVYVDGVLTRGAMHEHVENAELHFLPAISGGTNGAVEKRLCDLAELHFHSCRS